MRAAGDRHGDDPLDVDDYRRMFRLLEDVAPASALDGFLAGLREAFARRLGWTGVAALAGFTPELVTAARPGSDQFGPRYVEEYRERWWSIDPLASPRGIRVMRRRGLAVLRELAVDGSPGEREFVDSYLHRYGITDMVATVIGAGSAGVGFLGVPVPADRSFGGREQLIVHKLRRQLAAPLEHHLRHARRAEDRHGLTAREREVAELVSRGYTNDQVARELHVTVDTVKKHFSRVLAKTRCASRTQFVARWLAERP